MQEGKSRRIQRGMLSCWIGRQQSLPHNETECNKEAKSRTGEDSTNAPARSSTLEERARPRPHRPSALDRRGHDSSPCTNPPSAAHGTGKEKEGPCRLTGDRGEPKASPKNSPVGPGLCPEMIPGLTSPQQAAEGGGHDSSPSWLSVQVRKPAR